MEMEYTYSISGSDTNVVDDNQGQGLELNTTYYYKVYRIDSLNVQQDSSNTVNATTFGATSQNYSWESIDIGESLSSLSDVWGTDENNVYAVGSVNIDGEYYGILKWDGDTWRPELEIGGKLKIVGFSKEDIWVAGGSVYHYNGIKWDRIDGYSSNNQDFPLDQALFDNVPYRAIWGTNSEDLYFAGREGKIVHWNGSEGTMMETPTTELFIYDLEGLSNNYIIGVGYPLQLPSSSMIYNGEKWMFYDKVDINEALLTLCIINPIESFFGGSGIFRLYEDDWSKVADFGYIVYSMYRDKNTGEILAAGAVDGVMMNNGLEWKDFTGLASNDHTLYTGTYLVNGNAFCVGTNGTTAKIATGRRN